jgi:hypothetical protein
VAAAVVIAAVTAVIGKHRINDSILAGLSDGLRFFYALSPNSRTTAVAAVLHS